MCSRAHAGDGLRTVDQGRRTVKRLLWSDRRGLPGIHREPRGLGARGEARTQRGGAGAAAERLGAERVAELASQGLDRPPRAAGELLAPLRVGLEAAVAEALGP